MNKIRDECLMLCELTLVPNWHKRVVSTLRLVGRVKTKNLAKELIKY